MKTDDFEIQLGKTPVRPVPLDWRAKILDEARQTQSSRRDDSNTPAPSWWRQLLWPCPQAWAGMAVAWVFVIGVEVTDPTPRCSTTITQAKAGQTGMPVLTAGMHTMYSVGIFDLPEEVEALPAQPLVPPRRSQIHPQQAMV